MPNVHPVLADMATSISEFKKNPMAVIHQGGGQPVAVLNRNEPAFYCVPSVVWEAVLDQLEDIELARLVEERKNQKEIPVDLDDL
ncbi:antitoxin [Endozoicomonas sp. 4G]|uniref:type II toxin-antitoxin system Phd/YefM family antitoxin n=1 Tax=Endozoicomonas sp. 4G TaxID=2872754 RepID=UPI002078CEA6|nr:antitoxin [Endozoicomonas sp. 4G]